MSGTFCLYQRGAVYAACVISIITSVWKVIQIFKEILLKMLSLLFPPTPNLVLVFSSRDSQKVVLLKKKIEAFCYGILLVLGRPTWETELILPWSRLELRSLKLEVPKKSALFLNFEFKWQQYKLLVELGVCCLITEISVWPKVNTRHILLMRENRMPFINSHLSHILSVIWRSVSHWKRNGRSYHFEINQEKAIFRVSSIIAWNLLTRLFPVSKRIMAT